MLFSNLITCAVVCTKIGLCHEGPGDPSLRYAPFRITLSMRE
jgi:hypothetical protein